MKSTSLYFCQGSSDKEYHLQLIQVNDGYIVNFQYGRKGSSLQSGTKTSSPVSLEAAEKVYGKLLNEKLGKGYQENGATHTPCQTATFVKKETNVLMLPQLLNSIDDPETYINDNNYLAQEKIDGEHRIVSFAKKELTQFNKKGQPIPMIEDLVSAFKKECVVDGEMVGDNLYAFDLLSFEGKNLRGYSCEKRIEILNSFKFGMGVTVVETAYTTKEKRNLYEKLKKGNKEGIVFKRKDAPYTTGRPSTGGDMLKNKFYKTATFIVANLTKGKRSVGLELYDGKDKVFMGKVTIPPNQEVPSVGEFIEVRYLYCFKGGCVFQSTYLGKRNDQDKTDATIKQIIYK